MKRRDPVKFAIYAGIGAVVLMLAWSSIIEVKVMTVNGSLAGLQQDIQSKNSEYQMVLTNESKIADNGKKLSALQTLSAVRFLNGNLMDALQHATVDGVQLVQARIDQSFSRTEATKPSENDSGRTIPGKPATVTARTVLYLDAKDFSATPGDQVNKFKETLASQDYFKTMLRKTNGVQLVNVQSPQADQDGRPYVLFQIECDYPEVTQ